MGTPEPASRLRLLASAAIFALFASGISVTAFAAPAAADTAPAETTVPTTVSSDPLAAPQINGVVWDQEIVGDTVYVAGDFTKARPAGVALGVSEVDRTHLLAYDITTGALLPWAPTVNAQVRVLASSPDGTRLYAGGDFTLVNGETHNRIVAFDTASGSVATAFDVGANNRVYAMDATDTTVYFSGHFTSASSNARPGFAAAASAANGTVLPWAPVLENGRAYAVKVSPDGSKVVIGGDFTSANGSNDPGYGLVAVDSSTGASIVPWSVNSTVRNGGLEAAIYSLASDGTSLYGTGYVFGAGGNLEGTFRASWDTGQVEWVADCHGDTYSAAPVGGTVYVAGHAHYCGNIGGFPQTDPWNFQRALAFSTAVAGKNTADPYGYASWDGTPAPAELNWYPGMDAGTYTGQGQGPWSVDADTRYVVYGGEFRNINNKPFQGLVRFAVRSGAPNLDGPRLTGDAFAPKLASPAPGVVTASWLANWDRDNETLTYQVIRDGKTLTPAYTTQQKSRFYDQPTMSFVDSGLTPGQAYTYRLRAIDALGNSAWGSTLSITAASTGTHSAYTSAVMADQPTYYWRLGEAAGATSVSDSVGRSTATRGSGVTFDQAGAILGDPNSAARFSGTSSGRAISQEKVWRDDSFAVEAWFKTSSTTGGKIVGFGSSASGDSSKYDRHIYMNTAGRVLFGVIPQAGSQQILQTAKTYNDDQWHHVVGSMGPDGMQLHLDGRRVGQNTSSTTGGAYWGHWRMGGDSTWSGGKNFNGTIDEVAVYPQPLTSARVLQHFTDSGRTPAAVPASPADAYGAAVYAADPLIFWRLGEASGATANDAGIQGMNGAMVGTYTRGSTGALVGVADTATRFTAGFAAAATQLASTNVYSTEAWFKTGTNRGGRITGFGNSRTGLSSSYDRHVYMQNDGRLVFGVRTNALSTTTLTTAQSFNDDRWHHVVATQSSSGMRLYVDGELSGGNTQASAQSYNGYWRAGGDRTWGSTSSYLDGDIDEFAVYAQAMTAETVLRHYQSGMDIVPNVVPTAAFTLATTDRTVTFDAGTSSDGDGVIASYAWDFGDGLTGEGANPTHEYAAGGSYAVTLTVTDDDGATATATRSVITVDPNVPPTARFTANVNFQTVGFDASTSSDSDGVITEYAWDFGDGRTATGPTASHLYGAAGTYDVTLTITDNRGGSTTEAAAVTAVASPVSIELAADEFERTSTSGWGTASVGGAWTVSSAPNSTVSGGKALLLHSANSTRRATLDSVTGNDLTITGDFAVDKAVVGGSAYAGLNVRQVGSEFYQARLRFQAGGVLAVQFMQGDSTLIANATLPLTYTPGQAVSLKVRASGTSPTTLQAKAWTAGTTEPTGWSLTATSTSAGLQAAGKVGVVSYLSSAVTSVPLTVSLDHYRVATGDGQVPPPNVAPTAAFSGTVDHLTAQFDAHGSSDSDGTIAAYAWDFGDGQTGSGVTASHTYAGPGDFLVKLTVTDDDGATATSTSTVTPTIPEPVRYASDDFSRTVASGWGASTVGGAWQSSVNSSYNVADGRGVFVHATAGTTRRALLPGVSQTGSVTQVAVTVDKDVVAGQTVAGIVGRQVGADFYQGRIRLQPGGSVSLQLMRGSSVILSNTTISGLAFAAGDTLLIKVSVTGTNPTTIAGRIWKAGTPEPLSWQATTTDATAAMQAAGSIGLESYISGTATNIPITVRFDDFLSLEAQ
ncbi:PKD domain-containing protein [Agromyces salentinus]|uniref:PKD domain-containing protein n=1 Tax=Agromyces salentinus TaxID=269421 RepID=A0ABN2MLA7_9MICO|nr:PKD domain-containing protein [Agromyces salentinus]